MGDRRVVRTGSVGRRRQGRLPIRWRMVLLRCERLLAPGLMLVAAVIGAWLLVGAPARDRPASRSEAAVPVATAVPEARTAGLTASPGPVLPGSRLAGPKLPFGVDPDSLAADLDAAPDPTPDAPAEPGQATPRPALAAFSPVALPILGPRHHRSPGIAAPAIAVVIDDLGHDARAARFAIRLPGRLTLAFLPYGQSLPELTAAAAFHGHDVFLHLPMEPDGPDDPGPDAILTGLDEAELAHRLASAFDRVPGAVGVNNHMGSRATRDPAVMLPVLAEVRRRGLAFVDSRTSPDSVAAATAARLGLPHAARDVFLDNDPAPAAVRARLDEAERMARRDGTALAIGHPYPSTLAVLAEWLPEARARGVELVTARELIAREGCGGVVAVGVAAGC